MKPLRATRTAGVLKDLLDVVFWAIVVLASVHAALVVVSYASSTFPGPSVILVQPALTAIRFGEGLYVAARFERPGLQLWAQPVELPTTTGLFVGAVLLVAAEAFRRGAQLEEDQAFTV